VNANHRTFQFIYLCLFAAVVSRWTRTMKSALPAALSRGDFPRPDERDRIPAPVPDRNLGEGSSYNDEVAFVQNHFAEVRASFCSRLITVTRDTVSLMFRWSPSRELFAVIHPEEPPFNVL
jgi:hypothetical protein